MIFMHDEDRRRHSPLPGPPCSALWGSEAAQEQEPPRVLLELAVFIYPWQTAQNSGVRQIICGAKLKFMLAVFFTSKAPYLCAVGDA